MTAIMTIDKYGRVLIPKKIREALGLYANDQLGLVLEDGALTIKKIKP